MRPLAALLIVALSGCQSEPATPSVSGSSMPPSSEPTVTIAPVTPNQPVRIVALGDTGDNNQAQRAVAHAMDGICQAKSCDAVMLNGDNFYEKGVTSTDDPQWNKVFEDPYDLRGLHLLPFYVVLGNHDYLQSKDAQIAYQTLPVGEAKGQRKSARWHMPAAWYSVRVGMVELFAIDTMDSDSAEQKREIQEKLKASTARWKMVFGHYPRFTSGNHWKDMEKMEKEKGIYEFLQSFYCDADVYMAGHDHDLEYIDQGRDEKCPKTAFVISGAGSRTRKSDGPKDSKQKFFEDDYAGFVVMDFEDARSWIRFYDSKGNQKYEQMLAKTR